MCRAAVMGNNGGSSCGFRVGFQQRSEAASFALFDVTAYKVIYLIEKKSQANYGSIFPLGLTDLTGVEGEEMEVMERNLFLM